MVFAILYQFWGCTYAETRSQALRLHPSREFKPGSRLRRRMRLRTFLILVIPMLAVGLALLKRELDVIAVMDRLAQRGVVTLEPNGLAWVQELAHKRFPMWVRKVGWRYGCKVVSVDLYGTTDADIADLHYFKGVRSLQLHGRDFSIDGLRELRRLPELEELLLRDKGLSREEWDWVGRLLPNCRVQ
jgi:hypothetical protein